MALPSAPAPEQSEGTAGEISYIRTDPALPPVAIIDRSPIGTRQRVAFAAVALAGALAWALIALGRGEAVIHPLTDKELVRLARLD